MLCTTAKIEVGIESHCILHSTFSLLPIVHAAPLRLCGMRVVLREECQGLKSGLWLQRTQTQIPVMRISQKLPDSTVNAYLCGSTRKKKNIGYSTRLAILYY